MWNCYIDKRVKFEVARSRALLRSKYREYQAQHGSGPGLTTFATDQFFRQRDYARSNRPPPRDPPSRDHRPCRRLCRRRRQSP